MNTQEAKQLKEVKLYDRNKKKLLSNKNRNISQSFLEQTRTDSVQTIS